MALQLANMMNLPTLLVVVLIVVLLFGSAKIPDLMRGIGSGINEFKRGLRDGESPQPKKEDSKPPPPPAP
jgi:sec-independent protein translocase protein TatA